MKVESWLERTAVSRMIATGGASRCLDSAGADSRGHSCREGASGKAAGTTQPNDVKALIVFRRGDVGCEIANVKNLRSGYVYHAWSAKKPILRMITVALGAPEKTAE